MMIIILFPVLHCLVHHPSHCYSLLVDHSTVVGGGGGERIVITYM